MTDEPVEPVQVFVRIRPESTSFRGLRSSTPERKSATVTTRQSVSPKNSHSLDINTPVKCASLINETTIRIMPPDGAQGSRKSVNAVDDKIFTFDEVFNEMCSQEDIYKSVSTHVKATVRGYNTTIFAYGSTGSGKSYTMTGNSAAPGIIPRAISEIFSIIETTAAQESDVFFYVRLSYVELYNNNFRNLLEFASKELALKEREKNTEKEDDRGRPVSPTQLHPGLAQRTDKIEVRESQSAGVFLAGPCLRIPVTTAQEAFQLVAKGNKVRAVGSTQCNDVSSRSHAILTLHVESRVPSGTGGLALSGTSPVNCEGTAWSPGDNACAHPPSELRLGKMHLVDLAGSERIALSGAEGETLLETQSINLSLTAIGDVLSALSRNAMVSAQQGRSQIPGSGPGSSPRTPLSLIPVPYRNSKLTHLLKDSLGGNSKTIMVATVRTDLEYYQQTAITLKYASRAKKVRNRSLVNRNVIGDTGIHAVTTEIERLRSRLDERSNEFEHLRHTQLKDADENNALRTRLQHLKDTNENEKKQLETQMSNIIHSQAGQLVSQRHRSQSLQQSLQDELAVSQERIAKQERVIMGLKKALDDSVLAKHQPVEQMERMQKILDAWQAQANSTQKELDVLQKDSDALKRRNESLSSDLRNAHAAINQLHEEKGELDEVITMKAVECKSTQDHLSVQTSENSHLLELLDSAQAEALNFKLKLQDASSLEEEATRAVGVLRGEVEKANEKTVLINEELESANARISSLENDKAAILLKLEDTVGMLEERTTVTIEKATSRLQDGDRKLKLADDRLSDLKKELEESQNLLEASREELSNTTESSRLKLLQVTALLDKEKTACVDASKRCAQLNVMAQALTMTVSEKDALLKSAKTYLEDVDEDHKNIVDRLKSEIQDLQEYQKEELESLLKESEDLQSIHENEKSQLTQKFQEIVQGLQKRVEEELMLKMVERSTLKDGELIKIENGHTVDLLEQEKVLKEMHATELKEALDKAGKEHEKSLELTRAEGERVLQLSLIELKRRLDEVRERVSSDAEEGRDRALALQEQRHEEECATIKSHHGKELDDLRMQLVKENSSLAEQLENVENELRKEVGSVFKLSQEFLQSQRVVEAAFSQKQEFLRAQQILLESNNDAHEKAMEHSERTHTITLNEKLEALKSSLIEEQRVERERANGLLSELRIEQLREISGLKEQHEENIRTALDFQRDRLTLEFKDTLERSLASLTDKEETAARLLLEREQLIRNQCEAERAEREETSRLTYFKDMEELRSSLDADHQQNIATLTAEIENRNAFQIKGLRSDHDVLVEKIICSQKTEYEEMVAGDREGYVLRVEEILGQNEFKLEELRIELNEKHLVEMNKVLLDCKKENEAMLQQLRDENAAALKECSAQDRRHFAAQLEDMKIRSDEALNESLQQQRVELSRNYLTEMAQAVKQATHEHEALISRLVATHEMTLDKGIITERQDHAAKIAEMKNQHKQQLIACLADQKEEMVQKFQKQITSTVDALNQKHDQQIEIMLRDHEEDFNISQAEKVAYNDDMKKSVIKGEEKLTAALEDLRNQLERQHSDALSLALREMEELHETQQERLKEEHSQMLSSVSNADKEQFNLMLHEVYVRSENDLLSLRNDLQSEYALKIMEARKEHDREVSVMKSHYEVEVRAALSFEVESYHAKIEDMKSRGEDTLSDALQQQRKELSTAHSLNLINAVRECQSRCEAEKQSALSEYRNATEDSHSLSTRELVERIGKESREALDSQRNLLQKERDADIERARTEVRTITDTHEAAIASIKLENSHYTERLLESQKAELESLHKVTIREKEKASEKAFESSSAILSSERDLELSHMRTQYETTSEKHRAELKRLRGELLEAEVSRQKELSDVLQTHLEEMANQRSDMDASHNKQVLALRGQLVEARDLCVDLESAGCERKEADVRNHRLQREEFESTLKNALSDRDAQHKAAMQTILENQKAESESQKDTIQREREQFDCTIEELQQKSSAAIRDAEAAWRVQSENDIATIQERHTEALAQALGDAAGLFRAQLRDVQAEQQAAEEELKSFRDNSEEQQQELMTVIELLREQAEQIDQNNNAAITSQQELFRKELQEVKELHDVQYSEKEQKLIADFEQRIAQYEEQKNLAVLAVKEQRGSDLREMSELESRIEELQLALDLESTKTQEYQVLADQQMEYLKGEFKTRFKDLQIDFELRSEELKALLSDAHSHALVSAHALGDDDVKCVTAEYTSRLEVLSITHKEKLAMVESLHEIKLDTQKNEFDRKLEQATSEFENELKRRNIAFETDVTNMENAHERYVKLMKVDADKALSDALDKQTALQTSLEALKMKYDSSVESHNQMMDSVLRQRSIDIETAHSQGLSESAAAMRTYEEEISAIRISSEMVGYERSRLTEKELVDSLTRSLSELREGLEKQHEGDLDALSEEAVKVTNRLKAKLTSLELKNEQTESYNAQLIAARARDEAENIRIRQRLTHLESALKGREEIARELQAQSTSEAARDVAQLASKMENVRDKLIAECDALRTSGREHKKAFEIAIAERDSNLNSRVKQHREEVDKYEIKSREASLTIAKLTNDLRDLEEHSNTEATSLVSELKRTLEKTLQEKNALARELKSYTDNQTAKELSAASIERRARDLESAITEERRTSAASDDALTSLRNILLRTEQKASQLSDALNRSEDRRKEAENVLSSLKSKQESSHSTAEQEIARLREEISLGKTYAQGLMVQLGVGSGVGDRGVGDRGQEMERERGWGKERDRDRGGAEGGLRRALASQQNEMHGGYLNMLLTQVNHVMETIRTDALNGHETVPQIEAAHGSFLNLMRNLPEEWRQKNKNRNDSVGNPFESDIRSLKSSDRRERDRDRESDTSRRIEGSTSNQDDIRTFGSAHHQPKQPSPASSSSSTLAAPQPYNNAALPLSQKDTHPMSKFPSSSMESDGSTIRPPRSLPPYLSQSIQSLQLLQGLIDDEHVGYNTGRAHLQNHSNHIVNNSNNSSSNTRNSNVAFTNNTARQQGYHGSDQGHDTNRVTLPKSRATNGARPLPWTSPALRSSPTDQLISAALDGDADGIRRVITSEGKDLNSPFWKDLSPSILPLQRAISGLHFHGSLKLLEGALEVLIALGADPSAADQMGSTPLHKAVTVCASRFVCPVIRSLLCGGAKPSVRNQEGLGPLHLECMRVREASPLVVKALLDAGANPNERTLEPHSKNSKSRLGDTPLGILLKRCAAYRWDSTKESTQGENISEDSGDEKSVGGGGDEGGERGQEEGEGESKTKGRGHGKKNSNAGSSLHWLLAAELLVKSGATWDISWRSPKGESQLSVFVTSISAPCSDEHLVAMRTILTSALSAGLSPTIEDSNGRNAIFIFCQRMSAIPSESFQAAPSLLTLLLNACVGGLGASDHSGTTLFDIPELIPSSCLMVLKPLIASAAMKSLNTTRCTSLSNSNSNSNSVSPSPSTASAATLTLQNYHQNLYPQNAYVTRPAHFGTHT